MKVLITTEQHKKLVNEGLIDVLKQAIVQASKNPEVKKLIKKAMTNALKKGAAELEKFTRSPEDYIEALGKSPDEPTPRTRKGPKPKETEVETEIEVEVDESPQVRAKKQEIKKNVDILEELKAKKKKTAHDRSIIPMIEINVTKLKRELRELQNISQELDEDCPRIHNGKNECEIVTPKHLPNTLKEQKLLRESHKGTYHRSGDVEEWRINPHELKTDNYKDVLNAIDNLPDTIEELSIPTEAQMFNPTTEKLYPSRDKDWKKIAKDIVLAMTRRGNILSYSISSYYGTANKDYNKHPYYISFELPGSKEFAEKMRSGEYGSLD